MRKYTMNLYFPTNLKSQRIWVLWKLEDGRDGRITKVPFSANYNGHASSTNPKSWSTFDNVWRLYETSGKYNGVGIVIPEGSGLVFVDVDHCINEDGTISDIGTDVLEMCQDKTFIEYSQSGTGLHVIGYGDIPKSYKNSVNGTEMYNSGRFCAMTGRAVSACEVANIQPELTTLYERYKKKEPPQKTHRRSASMSYDDEWIIRKASEHGRFKTLYDGHWKVLYQSQSEADIALCQILAFWTNCSEEVIDRIFRSSGLNREKWESRPDYRMNTISRACARLNETLEEFIRRREIEDARGLEDVYTNEW